MNIIKRAKAPTSKFFKSLRTVGLSLAAAGGVIISEPIVLPLHVISIGGYLIVAGGILSAVSQITTSND